MLELNNIEQICSTLDVIYLKNKTSEVNQLPVLFNMENNTTLMSRDKYEAYDFSLDSEDSLYQNLNLNLTDILPLCGKFIQKFQYMRTFNYLRYNLIKYLYPVLLVFGILGNILSAIVMIKIFKSRKKNANNRNFSFCLAILCLSDCAILLFGCFREYAEEIFNISIRSSSIYSCKLFYFGCYVFSSFSANLYAFIAFERWQAITHPIKYKQKHVIQNQKSISLVFLYCFCMSLPFLILPTLQNSINPTRNDPNDYSIAVKCSISHNLMLSELLVTLLDSLFYCLIPFLITFAFSILTWAQLIIKRRTSTPQIDDNNHKKIARHLNHSTIRSSSKLKVTIMLYAYVITYMITTFPIFVIILLQLHFNYILKNSYNFETELAVSKMLMYINNSINILFLILFGKNLRKDFITILTFKIRKNKYESEIIRESETSLKQNQASFKSALKRKDTKHFEPIRIKE